MSRTCNPLMQAIARRERARTTECMRRHRASWRVLQRHGNASAFNGYRWTRSDYSCVRCGDCGRVWRTKAAYVEKLEDAPSDLNEWIAPDGPVWEGES